MALELSSAGVTVGYAIEATAGSRPTSGYTKIPNIKTTPDYNAEPSQLQVTDLSDTEWHRYIPGLKDVGGAVAFTANLTQSFMNTWGSMVSAAVAAKASNLSTWFEVKIPNFSSFYFSGMPSPLGLKGMDVDSVVEADGYITPNKIEGWGTSSS